ncbi:hypothetical protein LCGC14_0310910 [marine sediment metagenome]|uniref:Nucleoside 2-deoxyribosyltransferase n=1 Tax=marine sediment metagenome TaxID=412755 RepID=A0A0F9WTX3_9ZZZZ
MKIYLIGSLRNPAVPLLGNELRKLGFEVFDEWFGAGPEADDYWQKYEQTRGRHYKEALYGLEAENIYLFDRRNLDASDLAVMLLPAGKSGHIEFGYAIGQGKPGYILFDEEPERWDVMYQFASGVFFNQQELLSSISSWVSVSQ